MSHEIKEHDEQEGRAMAWHGLTTVNPALTLANCHLNGWDYTVEQIAKTGLYLLKCTDNPQVHNTDENGKETEELVDLTIGQSFSRSSFKPLTNAKLIALLQKATEGKDMVLSSCGTVMNRGRQFFSFQLGDSYRAAGRDFVPFFNIGNGNNRTSELWQNTSNTCTVCNNTFTMNRLNGGLIMSVKKTKNSDLKLADFSAAAKSILNTHKEFAQMFEALAAIKVTDEVAYQIIVGFLGDMGKPMSTRTLNNAKYVLKLFKTGDGNTGENVADIFSAFTDFYTHKSANGEDSPEAKWKNYVSSEFGNGQRQKEIIWDLINIDSKRTAIRKMGAKIIQLTAEKDAQEQAAEPSPFEENQPVQPA